MKQYERVVVLRLGLLTSHKSRGPGLVFFLPCIDSVRTVDLRIVTYNVPPLIVCDKVIVSYNRDVYIVRNSL